MKQVLLLFLLLCCTLTGKANTEIVLESDSLIKVLQTLPYDTTRLNVLNQIIRIEQNNQQCIQYSDTLMKEALQLENDKYAGLAAYYHILYYYNRNNQDSVAKWLTIMEPHARKSDLWNYFFDAKRFQIDLYTFNEQYELAINESQKMQQQASQMNSNRGSIAAYQCLSNAYIGSQRWDKGIEALEAAYQLLTPTENPVVRISVLSQLVSVVKEKKDNKKLLKYLDENTYFMYKVLYFDTFAKYYQVIGAYQQASDYIDTTLTMLKKDFTSDYAEQLLEKARIWKQAGQSGKAIPLYEQALAIKDSTATVLSNNQMAQIQSKYNIEKTELEQKRENNRIQLTYLIFIFVILLLLFIFMARLFMVRKALKYAENEIRKTTENVRKTNEIKNRFLSNMSYNIRTPLNNVVGFSQLIASEPNIDKEIRQEYSNIIHKSSEKLMRLVNDVLDLSRLEAQMMKFQLQDYDATTLCKEACSMAQMRNEETGIQIEFSSETDAQIHTDTMRLTQALISALVYPQEHRQARIIRFTLSQNEDMLRFRITNSPLADHAFVSQETIIRHDINLLLLKHFGGNYLVNDKTPEGPEIVFIYPIVSESK